MNKKHIRLESINIIFCGITVFNMLLTMIMFVSFIFLKNNIFFYAMLILLGSSTITVSYMLWFNLGIRYVRPAIIFDKRTNKR